MYFDFLNNFCLKDLILRRIRRDIMINYTGLHGKSPLLLLDFNETWILSKDFKNTFRHQISWKSVSGFRDVPYGGKETDTTKSIVALRTLPNLPYKTHTGRK